MFTGQRTYTVTGVVDESLGKSHLHANIFVTMNSGGNGEYTMHNDSWTNNNYIASYIKLRTNTNVANLEKKFPAFVNKYAGKELKEAGLGVDMYLQPISSIHTYTGNGKSGIRETSKSDFLSHPFANCVL